MSKNWLANSAEAIRLAKDRGEPYQVWQGDERHLRLEDLPQLKDRRMNGISRIYTVSSDESLRRLIKVGNRYAILDEFRHGWVVGEWN